jgi:hypothetical protein
MKKIQNNNINNNNTHSANINNSNNNNNNSQFKCPYSHTTSFKSVYSYSRSLISYSRSFISYSRSFISSSSFFIFIIFLFIIKINICKECKQAWNGSGTGAWFRIDIKCNYNLVYHFLKFSSLIEFPEIIKNETCKTDEGFYISPGIYDINNGVGCDVGLFYDKNSKCWFGYKNDDFGFFLFLLF